MCACVHVVFHSATIWASISIKRMADATHVPLLFALSVCVYVCACVYCVDLSHGINFAAPISCTSLTVIIWRHSSRGIDLMVLILLSYHLVAIIRMLLLHHDCAHQERTNDQLGLHSADVT